MIIPIKGRLVVNHGSTLGFIFLRPKWGNPASGCAFGLMNSSGGGLGLRFRELPVNGLELMATIMLLGVNREKGNMLSRDYILGCLGPP